MELRLKWILFRPRDVGATNKNPDEAITAERVIRPPQRPRGMIKGAISGRVGKTSGLMVVDLDLNWDTKLPDERRTVGTDGPSVATPVLRTPSRPLLPAPGPENSNYCPCRSPGTAGALQAFLLRGVRDVVDEHG